MSKYLTPYEARQIQKDASAALRKIFKQHPNKDRGHIADVENPLRQVRKGDAEKAIAKLHGSHDSGREIAKVSPGGTNAGSAIAAMHGDRDLAGRTIAGNTTLVAKLADAVAQAVRKDYASAVEAKKEIRKLLSEDSPRPRNYEIVKRAKCRSGEAILTLRKGAQYPFLLEVQDEHDSYYHSEYFDAEAAERAFVVLCAGAN